MIKPDSKLPKWRLENKNTPLKNRFTPACYLCTNLTTATNPNNTIRIKIAPMVQLMVIVFSSTNAVLDNSSVRCGTTLFAQALAILVICIRKTSQQIQAVEIAVETWNSFDQLPGKKGSQSHVCWQPQTLLEQHQIRHFMPIIQARSASEWVLT